MILMFTILTKSTNKVPILLRLSFYDYLVKFRLRNEKHNLDKDGFTFNSAN